MLRTVFLLPFLQKAMVSTFSLNDFPAIWILVGLHYPSLSSSFLWSTCTPPSLRIQNIDYLFQSNAVFLKQGSKLLLEFYFAFQAIVVLQLLKLSKLSSKGLL